MAPETRASDNALSYHPSLVEAVVSKSLPKKPYLSTSKIPEYSALPKTTAANAQASENLLPSNPYVTNAGISELSTLQKPSAADSQAFRNLVPRRSTLPNAKISESSTLPKTTAANAQASENLLPSNPYVTNAGISDPSTLQKPSAADAQAFRNHLPRRHQPYEAESSGKPGAKRFSQARNQILSSHEDEIDEDDNIELERLVELEDVIAADESLDINARPTDSKLLLLALLEQCPDFSREALRQFIEEEPEDNKPEAQRHTVSLEKQRFAGFAEKEIQLSGRDIHHLVRNSGSLLAQVGLKLHYPSFTTQYPNDGETADESSPCPRLLLRSGFSVFNAFWMQAYYRREMLNRTRCSPMKKLSPDLLSEHEAFSFWSEKNSAARVFIYFGAENRSRSLLQANLVTFKVSLDNGAAVTVSLETHSQTRRVTRIIVYAYHPEYLYRNPSTEVGKDYDLALGLTAVLGNVKGFRYGHFERRAEWLAKLGIRGRLPGDNALHDAIQILLGERRSSMTSSFDTLPQSILRWVVDDMKISDIDEVIKLVPEGMALVPYIHKRMVTKGGYAKAEKQRAMGLHGTEKARQAKRARPSKLQK